MSRPRKPARLYFRADEKQWVIRDGATMHRTGYGREQYVEAEAELAAYIASRQPSRRGPAHPSELTLGEVLARYADTKGSEVASPGALLYSIQALTPFWADLTADAVNGATSRKYTRERGVKASTARRELGTLQAALNHAHAEGHLIYPIKVSLPPPSDPKDRWLSRKEVRALLRSSAPHLKRFCLLSLMTGRRATAVLELTWTRVDLERGVIRFSSEGRKETNKRRGQVPIPRQLSFHLNRWQNEPMAPNVVSFDGRRVASIKTAFAAARRRAGLSADVTPHVLKHTAVTWAVQTGLGLEEASEYFDTSPETIRKHYWHHSPHHQSAGRAAVERMGRII